MFRYTRPLAVLPLLLALSVNLAGQATEGLASYYADRFHAKPTSTGETYSKHEFTAASKDYPYGTELEVTNVTNGKSVKVRVNDCGPHHPDRIIDLSGAAARQISLMRTGTAQVKLRVIKLGDNGPTCNRAAWSREMREREATLASGPVPPTVTPAAADPQTAPTPAPASTAASVKPAPVAPPSVQAKGGEMLFGVQVGAFGKADNAESLVASLKEAGFADAWVTKSGKINRVYAGHYYFPAEAKTLRDRLREAGYRDAAVRRVQ